MARVIYGALVTEIHGKLNGMVFQNNNFGNTLKMTPTKPPPPPLPLRGFASMPNAISRASQRWSNLTQSQRDSWNNYAFAFPQYAEHARSVSLAGYYVFMKRNLICELFDGFRLDEPDIISTPNPTFTPTLVSTTGSLLLTFNPNLSPIGIDTFIFCSKWSKGDNRIRRGQTKMIAGYGWSAGSIDLYSRYIAVFGSVPAVGSRIFIEFVNLGDLTGAVFAKQTYSILIG